MIGILSLIAMADAWANQGNEPNLGQILGVLLIQAKNWMSSNPPQSERNIVCAAWNAFKNQFYTQYPNQQQKMDDISAALGCS